MGNATRSGPRMRHKRLPSCPTVELCGGLFESKWIEISCAYIIRFHCLSSLFFPFSPVGLGGKLGLQSIAQETGRGVFFSNLSPIWLGVLGGRLTEPHRDGLFCLPCRSWTGSDVGGKGSKVSVSHINQSFSQGLPLRGWEATARGSCVQPYLTTQTHLSAPADENESMHAKAHR
jgi:hypothetical protein